MLRDQGIGGKKHAMPHQLTVHESWIKLMRYAGMRDLISSKLLWMEEIPHQLVTLTIGNFKTVQIIGSKRDTPSTPSTNWCRISSIHSM